MRTSKRQKHINDLGERIRTKLREPYLNHEIDLLVKMVMDDDIDIKNNIVDYLNGLRNIKDRYELTNPYGEYNVHILEPFFRKYHRNEEDIPSRYRLSDWMSGLDRYSEKRFRTNGFHFSDEVFEVYGEPLDEELKRLKVVLGELYQMTNQNYNQIYNFIGVEPPYIGYTDYSELEQHIYKKVSDSLIESEVQ